METTRIRYDTKRFEALKNNIKVLKPILEHKKAFLQEYMDMYHFPKKNVKNKVKMYMQLINALETIEKIDFKHNSFDITKSK